jgi:hypothetical protein
MLPPQLANKTKIIYELSSRNRLAWHCLASSGLAKVSFVLAGRVWIDQSLFFTAWHGLDWP